MVYLPREVRVALEAAAERDGRTMSAVIERECLLFLEQLRQARRR